MGFDGNDVWVAYDDGGKITRLASWNGRLMIFRLHCWSSSIEEKIGVLVVVLSCVEWVDDPPDGRDGSIAAAESVGIS